MKFFDVLLNIKLTKKFFVEFFQSQKAGKTKRKVIGETLLGSKEEKPEEGVVEEGEEAANQEPETPPTQENEEESAETVQSLSQHSINKCITLIILNPSCEKANEVKTVI